MGKQPERQHGSCPLPTLGKKVPYDLRGPALTQRRPTRLPPPGYPRRHTIGVMATREEAAASALPCVRLEGLDPGRAEAILSLWSQGQITDAQLKSIERRLLAGKPVDDLLPTS